MLEPDPNFSGGVLQTTVLDCNHDITYYNAATKTWNCLWDVNSKSNWLTTDGYKIVVDTNLAPTFTQQEYVTT
jgi:hypothetical protein